ncbi:hypothetical protein [Cohnella silvisoli]|uniref:NAD(P)-binding domain-containing protein n=1 Tax=Cohnella silvisoli TaxID=2873699 RepID=A0ABV1L3F4_9BACL|nr:hypothetical protein [Cohnella silvisoli]MCD9025959.1 hypothetical protein [Cohnella silvisoli]
MVPISRMCEKLTGSRQTRIYESGRSGDVRMSRLSPQRAVSVLDWKPTISLYKGLSRLIRGQSN